MIRRCILSLAVVLMALAALLGTAGCSEPGYADEREVTLAFSADTLSFDTLFTTVGSATRQVLVYNRSAQSVVLSSVTLEKGRASRFRLNVDGDTSLVARDVELLAGDSIFIFVQVTVSPNDQTSPFVEEDAILFGNGQRLPLTAWGRNAVYHRVPEGAPYSVVDCAAWDHSRPHVILGMAAVLAGNTLTLQAGDELHFYNNALLAIDSNASLVAVGTAEQPVLFTSLRHDGWYSFLPGQWQCLWFTGGSTGNLLDHTVVENGTGGLRVYPDASLTVQNTVIRNMSDCAIVGQGGSITGRNLLVYDCLTVLTVLRGGRYDFSQCTFANYWNYTGSSRQMESVVLTNYLLNPDGSLREAADLQQADFTDCIVYGSYRDSEVLLSGIEGYALNYRFTHSLVKGGEWDEDPGFTDAAADDYTLRDDSPALGIGYRFEGDGDGR